MSNVSMYATKMHKCDKCTRPFRNDDEDATTCPDCLRLIRLGLDPTPQGQVLTCPN